VAPDLARAASVTDAETELAAALVLTRKRRIGAYRPHAQDDAHEDAQNELTVRMRDMGLLARAGFSRGIAEQALDTPREDAENRIRALRQ
jgi:regulatory protein